MRPLVALLTILFTTIAPAANAADGRLNILVSNDDGWNAPGIVAVTDALRAAGHTVTVVAPLQQQSGVGVKITLGEYAVVEQAPGIWSVDGSPADAVSYGINHIMVDKRPDLVVSGANLGQNLGANVVSSGTVGAAVMAVFNGVPAIAVSTGLLLEEAKSQPERFPSTVAAYPATAAATVRLVQRLQDARRGDAALLPPRVLLNLNHPTGVTKGLRFTPLGTYGGFQMEYPPVAPGAKVISTMAVDERASKDAGTDTALFAEGYVTLSVLTPDWNAPAVSAAAVRPLLGEVESLLAH
jgi:5'-nucleotidase